MTTLFRAENFQCKQFFFKLLCTSSLLKFLGDFFVLPILIRICLYCDDFIHDSGRDCDILQVCLIRMTVIIIQTFAIFPLHFLCIQTHCSISMVSLLTIQIHIQVQIYFSIFQYQLPYFSKYVTKIAMLCNICCLKCYIAGIWIFDCRN